MAPDGSTAPGQILASRYRIGDRIGEGGMGVVYHVVDEQLRRPVPGIVPGTTSTWDASTGVTWT